MPPFIGHDCARPSAVRAVFQEETMNVPSFARPILLLVAIAGAGVGCAPAPAPGTVPGTTPAAAPTTDGLGAGLHAYLERVSPFGISAAFLVARGDTVILHEGYGLADRERGVAVESETVFDIGSITKQFTAAAILKLEEQGRLHVEDSIGRFFTDVPADKGGITLHHLLTHSSGLIGDLGGDYQVMPRDSLVRLALASELQWAPGTRFDYSNLGYSLLGAIVEIASGQPYERYLHESLFRPAGMARTGYTIPDWTPDELAVGYRSGRRWGTPLDHVWAPDGPWWNLRANGGILSTMGDLYRWHRALVGDAVLSSASREKMFTPHVPEGIGGDSHYGYGWAISTTPRGTRLIAHNGGNGYFFADFLRYVDEDVVIVLATNEADRDVPAVRQRVIAAVFSGRPPALPPAAGAPLPSADLESFAGTYQLPSGARIEVTAARGELVADAHGQEAAELLAGTPLQRRAAHAELSERTKAILAGAEREDFEPLRAASDDFERSHPTLQRIWRTAEENLGSYRSFDVLGTVTNWWSEDDAPVTFVRLDFERGSRLFRLHWEEGRIVGFGGMAIPNPARTTLLPRGDGEFAGYNLGIENPVELRFARDGDEPPSALTIRSAQGEWLARRVAR
jgi:CubicO group peptidase (beta-lactamase class C family)